MTDKSTTRRWLSTLARHYPSLIVSGVCHSALGELDELTAERDRLREALERIAEYGKPMVTPILHDIRQIAKAALETSK